MLNVRQQLTGGIKERIKLTGTLNSTKQNVYPELENLIVKPDRKMQTFTHPEAYGYDIVSVSAIEKLPEKDINFYDYDGELLYSYTLDELEKMDELPPLPEHEGLICQGWNWDLEDLKEQQTKIDVGPSYITDDGKTRIYIDIPSNGRKTCKVCFYLRTIGDGVEIDWGDGSEVVVETTWGKRTLSHIYAEKGNYIITLNPLNGAIITLGHGSNSSGTAGVNGIVGDFQYNKPSLAYRNMVKKIEIGNGINTINDYDLSQLYSLKSITIPEAVQTILDYSFKQCSSLKGFVVPKGVTEIGPYAFSNCGGLQKILIPKSVYYIGYYCFSSCGNIKINLPKSVTDLRNNCFENSTADDSILTESISKVIPSLFRNCNFLEEVRIPDNYIKIENAAFYGCGKLSEVIFSESLTNIESEAFYDCYSLGLLDFSKCKQIPNLSNNNAFYGVPTDCKFYIPSALYEEWKAATNWVRYASQMIAV